LQASFKRVTVLDLSSNRLVNLGVSSSSKSHLAHFLNVTFWLEKLFDSHTSGATGSEQESNNIPARGLWPAGAAAPLGPV